MPHSDSPESTDRLPVVVRDRSLAMGEARTRPGYVRNGAHVSRRRRRARLARLVVGAAVLAGMIALAMPSSHGDGAAIGAEGAEPATALLIRTDGVYARASQVALCEAPLRDDRVMRLACEHNAALGRSDFIEIRGRSIGVPAIGARLGDCYARSTRAGATDFAAAGACAREAERALAD